MKPVKFQKYSGDLFFGERKYWLRFLLLLLFISVYSLLVMSILSPVKNWSVWAWYVVAVFVTLSNAFYAGIRYFQDIHEIRKFGDALKYLLTVLFGVDVPKRKISGGRSDFTGEFDPVARIGGPCSLQINRDNVVVVETLQSHKNVLLAGERQLTRFDRIKDILSTEEQYGEVGEIKTLTADGIDVSVQGVQIRFRIDGNYKHDGEVYQTAEYAPLKSAVINLAYQRAAGGNGKVSPWSEAVNGKVSTIIREHISACYLDDLVAPRGSEEHPLEDLRRKFMSLNIQGQFKGMGVRFTSCNIGEIIVSTTDIDKENLRIWFVRQIGARKIVRAQGDAENFASQERGRAEGQAMLLKGIARALQEIGVDGSDPVAVRKNLRNILLTRTAQILEARTSIYTTYEENGENGNKRKL